MILFWSTSVLADWGVLAERAGFFGRWALGGFYETNSRHAVEASLGTYTLDHRSWYQINLGYRYSHWEVDLGDYRWRPLQVGIFGLYSLDHERYFLKSPGKYPSSDYYDQTAFRWVIDLATTFLWGNGEWGVVYHFRVLDSGVVAIYNNKNRDLQYYISSGFSIRYLF